MATTQMKEDGKYIGSQTQCSELVLSTTWDKLALWLYLYIVSFYQWFSWYSSFMAFLSGLVMSYWQNIICPIKITIPKLYKSHRRKAGSVSYRNDGWRLVLLAYELKEVLLFLLIVSPNMSVSYFGVLIQNTSRPFIRYLLINSEKFILAMGLKGLIDLTRQNRWQEEFPRQRECHKHRQKHEILWCICEKVTHQDC